MKNNFSVIVKGLIVILLFTLSQTAFCQKSKTTSSPPALSMYDTLSTQEMMKTETISNGNYQRVKIKYDVVELFYKGVRFATIAPELREKINPKYIESADFEIDSLNSHKILKLQLNYMAKGNFSIKDYK